MSTRCQIAFTETRKNFSGQLDEAPEQLIYRHMDGYPDAPHGVVAHLMPFLEDFQARRGLEDTQYAAAWAMWHLICLKGQTDYLGYAYCPEGYHGDIEYLYAVSPTHLDVYRVTCMNLPMDPSNLRAERIEEWEIRPGHVTTCTRCGARNHIVNACRCDPENLPTRTTEAVQ